MQKGVRYYADKRGNFVRMDGRASEDADDEPEEPEDDRKMTAENTRSILAVHDCALMMAINTAMLKIRDVTKKQALIHSFLEIETGAHFNEFMIELKRTLSLLRQEEDLAKLVKRYDASTGYEASGYGREETIRKYVSEQVHDKDVVHADMKKHIELVFLNKLVDPNKHVDPIHRQHLDTIMSNFSKDDIFGLELETLVRNWPYNIGLDKFKPLIEAADKRMFEVEELFDYFDYYSDLGKRIHFDLVENVDITEGGPVYLIPPELKLGEDSVRYNKKIDEFNKKTTYAKKILEAEDDLHLLRHGHPF